MREAERVCCEADCQYTRVKWYDIRVDKEGVFSECTDNSVDRVCHSPGRIQIPTRLCG